MVPGTMPAQLVEVGPWSRAQCRHSWCRWDRGPGQNSCTVGAGGTMVPGTMPVQMMQVGPWSREDSRS